MKRDPHIRCRKAFRFICNNLDEDIDSPQCREVRNHLDGCENCKIYLDNLKETIALYRKYPTPTLSRDAHTKLLKILKI
ncbi:MAG TPA: zf-HC2 domain-containing protein [Bacteroidota bacterium]|nr:zf-HC2 domain-containing protein [Bacteroidota bacterium]